MPPEQPERIDIDLNVLPPEFRRRQISPIFMLLWVLSGILLVASISSLIIRQTSTSSAAELQTQIAQIRITSDSLNTPSTELVELSNELAQVETDLADLEALSATVLGARPDWEAIGAALLQYDSGALTISEMVQNGSNLSVSGSAASRNDVLTYATWLEESNVFDNVLIQSMVDMEGPFVTPTPAVQTGQTPVQSGTSVLTTTPQATSSPYDGYEADDYDPQPISINETQWHSFSPIYDIDQVTFTGKAGRRYCILALPQSSGVDTTLLVTIGDSSYYNDDCFPDTSEPLACDCPTGTFTATRASMVEVQIDDDEDQLVSILVSNNGEYGADQWYTLFVSESTGDAYEDDDIQAKTIATGETQLHTFYPDGDIDRVTFSIKQGRAYEIRTTDLTLGLDTVITVSANGTTFENDDVTPGDRSSSVTFTATADGNAQVLVMNAGQFGLNMSYNLQVLEVGGDAYEMDDYVPASISPGEEQEHSFYPDNDIDRLTFNVKAGNTYALSTYSLTVGVDTVVSVLYNGQVYQNDDATSTNRNSSVQFSASQSGTALVTITNLDRYGSDKLYWVTLTESGTVATPGTSLYTPTPTCADAYEPDDIIPYSILVNQSYEHTLCSTGDIDRAVFTAKAGYAYIIETTDLGASADTVITALIGQQQSSNDDRSPQDLSSRLEVQNNTTSDQPVYITITNQGYYDENSSYTLTVSNAGVGDDYEPDDDSPTSITPGIQQKHTFYPPGDVDSVQFTAKSGHRYRIFTSSESSLVDTEIVVTMGSVTLRNDDRIPGDVTSYIELQNDEAANLVVTVTIFNKGDDDPDATYTLQVDDMGTTGSDSYEPDMTSIQYLSVGEIQYHTFYPDEDVDRVFMQVKAGRRYAVYTCGNPYQSASTPIPTTTPYSSTLDLCMPLVPGVDTVIRVQGEVQSCSPSGCVSDDIYAGSGYLNSRVEFEAISDGLVVIYIENEGLYGETREYYLLADEIGASITTPVPTTAASLHKTDIKLCSNISRPDIEPIRKSQDTQTSSQGVGVSFTLLLELREVEP